MALLQSRESTEHVDHLIGAACARNAPAEVHFEDATGMVITGRVRLLEMTNGKILTDRPLYLDSGDEIPDGSAVMVQFAVNGSRYQFESRIDCRDRRVRLNARQHIRGIALCKPSVIADSQRRSHLRVSLAGYDPISVTLVKPGDGVPDACAVDARIVAGWVVDVSVGGVCVLVHRDAREEMENGDLLYLSFTLPGVQDEFHLLGMLCHLRTVERSDSVRLGVGFRPWRGPIFRRDQHRISKFVAEHERRMLRRRR